MKQNKRRVFDSVILKHLLRKQTRDADDAEEWRSDEDGRHYKIETETGEIKGGFGGKLNGQTVKTESKPEPVELSFEELMGWATGTDPVNTQQNTEKAEREAQEETERQGYGQFGLAESEYPENLRLTESEREQVNNILRGFRDPTYKSRGNVDLENALRGWGSTLAQKEEQYKKRLAEAEEMIKERKAEGYSYKERHQGETGAQRKKEWWNYFKEHGEAPDGIGERGIQHWQRQRKQAQEALNGLELAKKVAAREEFARKNERYMPWRKNPNSENQEYRPWVKDAEPEVIPAEDVEDGGPGSGNWGHKGRPGLVGGSGKGGGTHYRGGREDIMFVGSRHDWLNGLKGDRQREVSNMLKEAGNGDIKQGQIEILKGSDPIKQVEMLKAMGESRKLDAKEDHYLNELSEEERAIIEKIDSRYSKYFNENATRTDKIESVITMAKSDAEARAYADLWSKAMGGETSGAEMPKSFGDDGIGTLLTDETLEGFELRCQQRAIGELQRIMGNTNPDITGEEIDKLWEGLPSKAFETARNTEETDKLLTHLGVLKDYGALLENSDDPLAKRNLDILKKYNQDAFTDTQDLIKGETALFNECTEAERQEYLSNKYQILGGAKPLEMTVGKTAKSHTEAIAKLRSIPKTASAEKITQGLWDSGAFKASAKIDISRVSPVLRGDIAESYAKVIERFPFMWGRMGSLTTQRLEPGTYAQCQSHFQLRQWGRPGWGYKHIGNVQLGVTDFVDDPEKAKEKYEHDVKEKFHVPGTHLDSVLTHELGHSLDGFLCEKLGKKASMEVRRRVAKRMKTTVGLVNEGVSRYAGKNEREFFAECITELLHCEEPRETARVFAEELEAVMKEGGII